MTILFYWLSERLRDFTMWPINLLRDFPLRSGRLLRTIWRGGKSLFFFVPEMGRAVRQGEGRAWLQRGNGRFANWLHQLLIQTFDLFGGPEIAQFFMHLFVRTTPLTGDEISLITSILGSNALRFGDVRVAEGGLWDLLFKLNGNLAFATWHTINLPRTGQHARQSLPILVHELIHVYQYEQIGSRYLSEAIYVLIKTKRDCYDYGGAAGLAAACEAGLSYCDFNREQQAKIIQDYYTLLQQGSDVSSYHHLLHQACAGEI